MFKKLGEFLKGAREKMEKKIKGERIPIEEMLIPKRFRGKFEVKEFWEKEKESTIELREKEIQIPEDAQKAKEKGEKVVKNGYLRSVEVLAGSRFFDPMYIRFERRRWKNQDTGTEYWNEYDFHPEGMKVLHEFAEFLKKINRREFNKLFNDWESTRYLRKEDFCMVQRLPEWIPDEGRARSVTQT